MSNKITELLIGKQVIVRTKLAGVHFGTVEAVDFETKTVSLTDSRRLWRVYTRDISGSLSDIAANGLRADKEHSIGALLKRVVITEPDGLEIDECTDTASKSILAWDVT